MAQRRTQDDSFADSARSRYGPDPTQMLRFAIREGNRRLFDLALQDGASLLGPLDNGENPIPYAAAFNNDALGWLLKTATAVDEPDQWGRRPLHIATALGQAGNVRKLLNAGADASSRDNEGRTPLHDAARNSRNKQAQDIMALLIERGADLSSQDRNGVTPLMGAAFAGQVLAVKWLVEHGARLDMVDRVKNWSVLSHAARGGAVAVLEYLLTIEPGALRTLNRGSSAVKAAVDGLRTEALEFLLQHGAKPDKARLQEILDIMEYDHPVKEAQECRAILERYLPG